MLASQVSDLLHGQSPGHDCGHQLHGFYRTFADDMRAQEFVGPAIRYQLAEARCAVVDDRAKSRPLHQMTEVS